MNWLLLRVGIEDLVGVACLKASSRGCDAKSSMSSRVRQPPGENVATYPVHHRDQIEKARAPSGYSPVMLSGPHLIYPFDPPSREADRDRFDAKELVAG